MEDRIPNRAPIAAIFDPATRASTHAQINTPANARRTNNHTGNNTWVTRHERHRPRRGVTATTPAGDLITRSRADPHGPSTPTHGHRSNPPQSRRSTLASSPRTVCTGASKHPQTALPRTRQSHGESRRLLTVPTMTPGTNDSPTTPTLNPPRTRSMAETGLTMPTGSGA